MAINKRWLVVGGVAAFALLWNQVNWLNIYRPGTLRDIVSQQPIAGADLTLDCRKLKFHGSASVRQIHAVTSADGRYSFRFADTWDCAHVFVRPRKDGYKDADTVVTLEYVVGGVTPKDLWMVREVDIPRLQLEGLLNRSKSVRIGPEGRTPVEAYATVSVPFFESIRIASSPAEIKWVQDNYCSRLAKLWASIGGADQTKKFYNNYGSHADVLVYCGKGD
ncbi:MAG: hypothetical protein V4857_27495 [Pseudomonadota bacterium]